MVSQSESVTKISNELFAINTWVGGCGWWLDKSFPEWPIPAPASYYGISTTVRLLSVDLYLLPFLFAPTDNAPAKYKGPIKSSHGSVHLEASPGIIRSSLAKREARLGKMDQHQQHQQHIGFQGVQPPIHTQQPQAQAFYVQGE